MSGISQLDIKKLFSLSAGRCNICSRELIEENVQIGEMAHIIARSPGGPRSVEGQSNNNSYDNLILLCSVHHKVVDSALQSYSAERLFQIKRDFENSVSVRLDLKKEYIEDLGSLNRLFEFIDITNLRQMAIQLPESVPMIFVSSEYFTNFVEGFPHLYPFNDKCLTQLWEDFIFKFRAVEERLSGNFYGERFISFQEMLNEFVLAVDSKEYCVNIYVGCNDRIVLNKRELSHRQLSIIYQVMKELVQNFIYAHTALIEYIRSNFKDIKW